MVYDNPTISMDKITYFPLFILKELQEERLWECEKSELLISNLNLKEKEIKYQYWTFVKHINHDYCYNDVMRKNKIDFFS